MTALPIDSSDDQILAVARAWAAALAEGNFERAYAITAHDPHYQWTPDRIGNVIAGNGLPLTQGGGRAHRVTSLATATGPLRPRHEVHRFPKPRSLDAGVAAIGEVWFDLPLDGAWSDLTATFELQRTAEHLLLVLNDIHVF
jgi:hypothetical protein